MRRLSTLQLVPGMVVAEDVISYNKQVVLKKGSMLTDKLITKLSLYGILTLRIEDAPLPSPPSPDSPGPREPSYSERIKKSEEFKQFKAGYEEGIDAFKLAINSVVERNLSLDVDRLLHESLQMIAGARGQAGILDMLQNMREYDDSTFTHCMNVGLICNVLATWLNLTLEETEMATACGLFHDIGKLLISHDIIAKPGKLSEEEYQEVKRHPLEGYQLLLSQNVDRHISNAALMHHERCDGSGYPLHLKEAKIDPYAKIVAIADVYDAMTAARVYRGPLCPFQVIEIFESEGLQKYDAHYILTFLENVVNTYIQNRCRLSDGREANIIYINRDKLSRPIVQCGAEYIDLAERPELYIENLL